MNLSNIKNLHLLVNIGVFKNSDFKVLVNDHQHLSPFDVQLKPAKIRSIGSPFVAAEIYPFSLEVTLKVQ